MVGSAPVDEGALGASEIAARHPFPIRFSNSPDMIHRPCSLPGARLRPSGFGALPGVLLAGRFGRETAPVFFVRAPGTPVVPFHFPLFA
jgi:hypothetical protein